jgi:HSP20 family protein
VYLLLKQRTSFETKEQQEMATQTLPVRKAESVIDEIERLNQQIMRRAYDIFAASGGVSGNELNNWLAAERELVWRPAIEMREKNKEFLINIAVPGIDPADVSVEVTPDVLLVRGEFRHEHADEEGKVHTCEFEAGSLFRVISFPKRVDLDKVKADFKNGIVRVRASIAEEQKRKKVAIEAA